MSAVEGFTKTIGDVKVILYKDNPPPEVCIAFEDEVMWISIEQAWDLQYILGRVIAIAEEDDKPK